MLIQNEQLGERAYIKVATIMQTRSKHIFFKSEDDNTKQSIISGFKNLYKDYNKITQQSRKIAELMNNTFDLITKVYDTTNIKPPHTLKSKAKDLYGYSQKKIIELVKAQNLKETIIKFKWLINILKKNVNNNLIINNTKIIILKKKK